MGTDINGWVEIQIYEQWHGVLDIRYLLYRNYDAFACLFGVNNYAGFKPIVANRDLPKDASDEVYHDEMLLESKIYTWISLAEINAIDWDEYGERPNERPRRYRKNEAGEWQEVAGGAMSNPPVIDLTKEGRFQVGDTLYEIRRMQRREVFDYWEELFEIMNLLAKKRGEEKVRLVVYFDW